MKQFIQLVVVFLVIVGCSSPSTQTAQNNCVKIKGSMDIGSGQTKILVAEVNQCLKKVLNILAEEKVKISFLEDLQSSSSSSSNDYQFGQEIQKESVHKLGLIKTKLDQKYPQIIWFAGATAAFREAKNGKDFLDKLSSQLDLPAAILSQDDEAKLGFKAVLSDRKEDIIVWDIGGGSMQLTTLNSSGSNEEWSIYQGLLSSVSFKNMILVAIQGKTLLQSPNPLGEESFKKASDLIHMYVSLHVPKVIKEKIRGKEVYGIGSVHNFSIKEQISDLKLKKNFYTIEDLEELIKIQIKKNDHQLNSSFAETQVTNLILVHGYMKVLGIPKIFYQKTSLGESLLFKSK